MPRIFRHRFTVTADAIDALGHVNNLQYVAWMQDVAISHSAAQGWDMERYAALGCAWVVRSHHVEYLRPAFAGDEVELLTWVAGFSPRASPRRYLFRRAGDGKALVEAETVWVFVDLKSGQPRRVPDAVREAFEVVGVDEAPKA